MPAFSIWCNRQFDPAQAALFERSVAPHSVVWARQINPSNLVAAPSDASLVKDCQIAYGQPSPSDIVQAQKLQLVCLSSAGYTRYDTDELRRECKLRRITVCNASGVYDEPCAQHALAMMLATTRQLPQALQSQSSTRGWPYLSLRGKSGLLDRSTVILLVGYGSIARRLAELLSPFKCDVRGFRRTLRGDENVPSFRIDELDAHMHVADHLVNILPDSSQTRGFFNAARFAQLKPGAHFYNLGRGETVEQSALVDALDSGRLASAYLDVTAPEPLPGDHPLWSASNCFITPHTAGGTHDEAERQIAHFEDNLRRYERGDAVRDRIF